MKKKCDCKKFKKKFSCCYKFKPIKIDDSRNSCLLIDTYDKGINQLNELVLGALNACVNINEKLNENKNRKKNRTHLRFNGKTVCRKVRISLNFG
jgi:hypothetical protein